jgi:hypothetical protein
MLFLARGPLAPIWHPGINHVRVVRGEWAALSSLQQKQKQKQNRYGCSGRKGWTNGRSDQLLATGPTSLPGQCIRFLSGGGIAALYLQRDLCLSAYKA